MKLVEPRMSGEEDRHSFTFAFHEATRREHAVRDVIGWNR